MANSGLFSPYKRERGAVRAVCSHAEHGSEYKHDGAALRLSHPTCVGFTTHCRTFYRNKMYSATNEANTRAARTR